MFKKIFIILIISFANISAKADVPYYMDFNFILNESVAGKKAQSFSHKIEGLRKKTEKF